MPRPLDRCVQSISAQTLQDFELFLIDDGSPDRCGEMCDAYAEQDSRIHVIHKKNAGVSASREKRYSYAASFGISSVPEKYEEEYKRRLKDWTGYCVREKVPFSYSKTS